MDYPFFAENTETHKLFKFCVPAIKLPAAKTISGQILKDASEDLVKKKNISIAQKDLDGVTAAFDGWTNVRSEHLFCVVFITSEGKTITCGTKDINSAGEYAAAARRQMHVEYKDKIFLPSALKSLVAKFSPQRTKSRRSTTTTNTKFLPEDIIQVINNPTFWFILFGLQNLLLPLYGFLNKLQKDIARLHEGKYPFDPSTVEQFERLRSTMGFIHTKRRNRLENKKVLNMARIRSDILYKRKVKEGNEDQKKTRCFRIALPILNDQDDDDLNREFICDSDLEDEEDEINDNLSDNEAIYSLIMKKIAIY
ncbi:hypothetical protein GLOIN_2v1885672 [Rhizophagus clarus]|uniref:DUF659 domain-containing protein n=1 Tax=Rhizophagus clarus TaxID=94130 RepID=A0A8H3QHD9_9GLOM|nr:hypothetical protein GLOIN_2v1885672 [Rhizophagus clarus]